MIPADVVSRLKLANDLSSGPTTPLQQLKDSLSDFVPGQRVMAEIQALLPNGTYRAMVAQREVTLALPFSAKPGDSMELEVVEHDGKLTFATRTTSPSALQAETQASVATNLSKTGQLIGELLGRHGQQSVEPTPLNGKLPLVETLPAKTADLVPILKHALKESGMFYESHQAQWLSGQLSTRELLQEPQGQLSRLLLSPAMTAAALATSHVDPHAATMNPAGAGEIALSPLPPSGSTQTPGATHEPTAATTAQYGATVVPNSLHSDNAPAAPTAAAPGRAESRPEVPPNTPHPASDTISTTGRAPVSESVTPIVQQQLEALATQTYAWQGQVWPGQTMQWEIIEDHDSQGRRQGDDEPQQWQTRLRLTLPLLGKVDALIALGAGGKLDISVRAGDADSMAKLAASQSVLQNQLDSAGLQLNSLKLSHEQESI